MWARRNAWLGATEATTHYNIGMECRYVHDSLLVWQKGLGQGDKTSAMGL
jgi:hypothetical protein